MPLGTQLNHYQCPSPSEPAAAVHLINASATVPLKAFRSNARSPCMVEPPGVATFSFNISGDSPANISMAAPFIVSAAMVWASERLSPSATAPSSSDSRNKAKKAGVLPQRAVQASNWPAVMCVTVPMVAKSQSTRLRAEGVAVGVEVMTVVEARTKEAVFGIARMMVIGLVLFWFEAAEPFVFMWVAALAGGLGG